MSRFIPSLHPVYSLLPSAKRGTPLENLAPGHFPVREQRRGGVGIFFHHNPHSAPQTRQGNLSPPGQEGEIRVGANPRAGEGRAESKGHRPRIGTQEYRTKSTRWAMVPGGRAPADGAPQKWGSAVL